MPLLRTKKRVIHENASTRHLSLALNLHELMPAHVLPHVYVLDLLGDMATIGST